jgi:spermidine synthase
LILQYLTPQQLETTFSPWRLAYFSRLLQQSSSGEINRDFRPRGTLHRSVYNLAVRDPALAKGFNAMTSIPYGLWLAGLAAMIVGLSLFWNFLPRSASRSPLAVAVGVAGMTGLASEMVILLLYQIVVGYLYLQIGLLMASFMAGLSLGAFWISRNPETASTSRGPLIFLQITLAVVPLLLWAFLQTEPGINDLPFGAINLVFYLVMLLAGFLGGAHYQLATRVHLQLSQSVSLTAGGLYGADLLGSALGSLLVSFLWLPAWGISRTLVFLSLLNLLLSLALWAWRMPGGGRKPPGE